MKTNVSEFDFSEYLSDEESIAEYLTAIIEENDTQMLLSAIGDIAKAQGMNKIASESGLGRESLYKALNANAKPRFETIVRVTEALGVSMCFSPKHAPGSQKAGCTGKRNPTGQRPSTVKKTPRMAAAKRKAGRKQK